MLNPGGFMRPISRAVVLILGIASLTMAQEAPDPFLAERILPQNALVFLSIPQSSFLSAEYAKSNLAKLVDHPEIRSFIGPLESWWKRRKTLPVQAAGRMTPSFNDQIKEMTGLTIDEIWELLQGPLSCAVYDLPVGDPHKLDVVLTLGASDGAKLEKAAVALKDGFRRNGGVKEGEFARGGTTIHEFGNNSFRVYHALIRKTIIVATRQERIEQIVDASVDKAFAGLQEDPAFKAARARVAPESRHLFLFYANLTQTLKQYRREIGDETLRVLETLGIADIPALAASLSYDGPFIRERYALMTSRQDRGLLKFLAGGTPDDPYAALVPAGSISYSHQGLNPAELYDVLMNAAKISPDFASGLEEMFGQYEKRVGFRVRDAFATLGSSWTSWSTMPEGGGIWPDTIWAVPLLDPGAFESALEKAVQDAGFPHEELTFRGRKIRYVTLGLQGLVGGLAMELPDFLSPSLTMSYLVQDKSLFLATQPMAIKRLILRSEGKMTPIREQAKYAALAARTPAGDLDSWTYLDLGRALVIGYAFLEPSSHLMRDMARDETGELVLDLARLPLEETLADLIGPTFIGKRTTPDSILLESRSNLGASLSSGTGFLVVAAAVAIPTLTGFRPGGAAGGIAGNEMIAEVSLQFIRQAEETFKNSDSDANGVADYWTRDVAGLHSIKDRSGQAIFLIDPATAAADPEGAPRYKLTPAPKNGYYYRMMVSDPDGEVYQKDEGKTNKTKYGVVAYPAAPGETGRFTFITKESGKTWKKDTQGRPVDRWPGKDPAQDGWTLAE
jgi:hypothetical protein